MINHFITLQGRIIIQGYVEAVTGLHVGGAAGALEIGGVDSPVIRNPLNNEPYLPGSSIRGKMRSLTEKLYGSEQNFSISKVRGKEVKIHTCQAGEFPDNATEEQEQTWRSAYKTKFCTCPVCSVFGVTGDEPVPHPTSLIVRDAVLTDTSRQKLKEADTDFPLTEIKWEATIDRVTSAAVPRQIERVPAGTIFEGFELIYNIYDISGRDHFVTVLKALQLIEEDYLGGLGSRGGGKVKFKLSSIYARKGTGYEEISFNLCHGQSSEQQFTEAAEKHCPITGELINEINQWVARTFADLKA